MRGNTLVHVNEATIEGVKETMGVRVWVVICLGLLVSAVSAAQRLEVSAFGRSRSS